MISDSYY
ncbi:hypothetical protein VCHC57A2_1867, partial [Vibrio cholerae HC-57A2]